MGPGCGSLVATGVGLLDKMLPRGIPRRSLVLLVGEGGAGKSLLAQLMLLEWARRGWPTVYVSLDDDAETVYSSLRGRGGPLVEELLAQGRVLLVDGFLPRYGVPVGRWERVETLEPGGLLGRLAELAERRGMSGCGLLVLDSLNPLLLRYEPTVVYGFVEGLRARLAKRMGVTTVAVLHTPTQLYADIAATLGHMVDVFIVVRLHGEAVEAGLPVRQLLVKKAKGVPSAPGWVSFIVTDEGLQEVRLRHAPAKS